MFETAHAVGGKMWQQFDADAGGGNETALAGDAEFVGVGRADVADGFKGVGHGGDWGWE